MNSVTLKGLEAQISVPTDVAEYIRTARVDRSGTNYPGALQLAQALHRILIAERITQREVRLFAARFVVALEGYQEEADEAIHQIGLTLANVDLKKYW